jgi:glycine/D-amino acid oxidase-like deaminating enzyme
MNPFPDSPLSLWLETYGDYSPEPPLQGSQRVDVAIIGGGFTGLMTAYELVRQSPGLEVAVLEAKTVGYGASGRNGSFAMTVVGLGIGTTAMLRGKAFLKAAHSYMEQAVERLDAFIAEEQIDCDRIRPGFLRVATTPGYIRRLQHDIELIHSLGFSGIEWLEAGPTKALVNSDRYLGGMLEHRLLLVNPARLVREEKRVAMQCGVKVFENSPVTHVELGQAFRLTTPQGDLQAEKVIFATNAYTHLFPQLRRKQIPAFTYMIATEPLSPSQLEPIGWQGRHGIEDARNLIHYYRLTPDNRIVLGGGPVGITYANSLHADTNLSAWQHLEEHLLFLFPHLRGVQITHRWGGPFSVTPSLSPQIGAIASGRAVYSLGCTGHGVSTSHLNAGVIRDLILDRPPTIDCPFLAKRSLPWPGEPIRSAAALTLRAYLQAEDAWYERGLN